MMLLKKTMLLSGMMLASLSGLWAQGSPEGIWKTVDDKTGESKSTVEIYEEGGRYFGKITALLRQGVDPNERCAACKGDKKGQPMVGLIVIEDLESHQDYWRSGTILDPENGNEYRCSVWFEEGQPNELKVRGKHWTGIYRTQTWYRVK